jgi:flagellar protein FliO/FliZ
VARRPLAARAGGALTVVARQQLTRNSAVAVVRVADKALVLGITDQQVTLLAETDSAAVEVVPAPRASGEVRERLSLEELTRLPAPRAAVPGRLNGSALSPDTWRQAAVAVRQAAGALRKGLRP